MSGCPEDEQQAEAGNNDERPARDRQREGDGRPLGDRIHTIHISGPGGLKGAAGGDLARWRGGVSAAHRGGRCGRRG
jgi:hypothetical protein